MAFNLWNSRDTQVVTPNSGGQYPPEPKTISGTIASYLATAVATALLNIVQDEDHALLFGTLPEWLETLLLPVFPAALTFIASWLAKHQHRRPLPPASTSGTTVV